MTSRDLDALVFLAGYGVLLVAAVRVFGLRRVVASCSGSCSWRWWSHSRPWGP